MKNKKKEKTFVQGPIMLGITIGLGIFVCTAALMIGLSYFGIIGGEAVMDTSFTPKENSPIRITIEDGIGVEDKIEMP